MDLRGGDVEFAIRSPRQSIGPLQQVIFDDHGNLLRVRVETHNRVLFECGEIDRPVGRLKHAIRLWSRRDLFNFCSELSVGKRLIEEMLGFDAIERDACQWMVVEPALLSCQRRYHPREHLVPYRSSNR